MGERLKYWLYLALFMPLAWLPLPALYLLSDLLRPLFQHVIHYRRKVIRRNLQSCYPEKSEAA
ncbi:MAG: acetyltransferase, partial [Paramuribaculum sp.]|nr:acetyltransferase [Paramuribaculum sp.]